MVSLQILNKVIATQDYSLIQDNNLTVEYFVGYENEYNFIKNHFENYGKVPDKETFLSVFQDFSLLEVTESDSYLIDTINEELLYYRSVEVVQKVAELLKVNANDAVEYLHSSLPLLESKNTRVGIDIISEANQRLSEYEERKNSEGKWYITTGLEELDSIVNGWAKGEEFVVFFARTGQGKSWVLIKTCAHAWQLGYRVGYISPEMSPSKIGYRFDTVTSHFSNKNLTWGHEEAGYAKYINELSTKKNPFIVATPKDFQNKVTVSKLRNFCKSNQLDIIGIDGITYLSDERYKRGDTKTTSLTNISEDLMALSLELQIPVLVVVQSNRTGVKTEEEKGTPELEAIRDSDGIAQNATKVISLRQTGEGLEFGIKKHRDGATGGKLIYNWDIDKGEFSYVPSDNDSIRTSHREKKSEEAKRSFSDGDDVF